MTKANPSNPSKGEPLVGLAFISPWLIGFLLFMALPIAMSFYYSLTHYTLLEPPIFAGLENYRALLGDSVFWTVMRNTVIYAVIAVPLSTVIAVGVAVLLSADLPGIAFFRASIFMPAIVPLVAAAMIWSWLFNGELGMINRVLDAVLVPLNAVFGSSLQGPNWLGDAPWVMPALIIMSVWGIGQGVVVYIAGIKDVPAELYEAAELDGISAFGSVWHITVPMISPVVLFNVIVGMIGTWQVFAVPYIMLGASGGPDRAGYFFTMYLYDKAFSFGEMGYASALAWIQLLIILAGTALTFLASRRLVHYTAA
ncbi:MAG: sugar ABC transporter permease [Planctomycetota bacterium]